MMFHLLLLLTFVLSAHSIFILCPLYIYPGNNASAWGSVVNAVASNSKVQWQIVINPNNGPGYGPGIGANDSNYVTGVSRLKKYSNVKILGYVDTAEANKAQSLVQQDINTYANWPANMAVDGIFFDDVTNCNSNADQVYYYNVTRYAYATVPTDVTPVILNPGALANVACFGYCDTMIEFENAQVYYKNQTTINTIPSGYQDQSAILIHNSTATAATVTSLVKQMSSSSIEAVYFTTDCCYNAINLTLLQNLVTAVAAVISG
jgi:hypothetical protein